MTDLPVQRFRGRDGVELAYRERGEGRPLVLFHGFTGSASQWVEHGQAAVLAERGHRVVLPDLRGHGESARPHDPVSYPSDVLVDDGLALIASLGLDDYDLGGYSLGGRVVLRMLARGARPAHAIVAGQGLDAVTRVPGRPSLYRRVLTLLVDQVALEPGSPEAEQAYWITRSGGDPIALLHVLDSLVATPDTELRRIATPTLVLAGDQDLPRASGEALAATLVDARFGQVPGNHFTALAAPELTTAIVDFLA